ncbi:MAG: hypothetical protein COZ49_02950 [Candidatus Yonathbacteria bacterium CG_4_10_14_3_um_filter_47_65]|uniref:Peptidase C39-like domain-containing protein n=2 Tax=Parcubacteria group TaxID=1794811 RepID=A0A2M8D6L4_9BACT|nr:MAG: hypothetical protein AUJ44_04360 [Candidatus Nomurabacteria bacterium CG1_02_47_685]PIP03663.1 MAG: hypothetical protein COX54_02725 [Candidatus Yonathbacteria bacterium CG23_combo_of_CG06-09_8_20_14_all_46_18]PIQ31717.1 MAG: hypothetical protein COW61_03280 [Candidatus Yonathbacteria bacterium CG17_big_fil_post_rev_8_21_14_2_50_46_19]PIX56285.1 MAG: hypothetical protein COZ49_02950 [Candidatus Yonathbacteria bacterium CG_4_10_14_3_um_filter_47_65]PIY57947.1 MAG: hypothetical protein CO
MYTVDDLLYRKIIIMTFVAGALGAIFSLSHATQAGIIIATPAFETAYVSENNPADTDTTIIALESSGVSEEVFAMRVLPEISAALSHEEKTRTTIPVAHFFDVPFYSQFRDISDAEWQKRGCGIASLAMLIDFYKPGEVSADTLLDEGIASGVYQDGAGWKHQGLALLANDHSLRGVSYDLSSKDMDTAFAQLENALKDGPVIASVYYTFDPKSPIPHLVVVSGVDNDIIYYNDPSDTSGGGSISTVTFKRAWKKRYITVRPLLSASIY